MRQKLLILISAICIMFSLTTVYASEGPLTKIEALPGSYTYINPMQKSGEVEIYGEDGSVTLAKYKITQTNDGEYITFIRVSDLNYNMSNMSSGSRYWKDEVYRTYPDGSDYPTYLNYSEIGRYGYASGTLWWYAFGKNYHKLDYTDVWYEGWLYYGEYSPFSATEINN